MNNFLQLICAGAKLVNLAVGQLVEDLAAYALIVNQHERRQAHIGYAVFAVHHGRDSHSRSGGTLHTLAQMTDRHRNGIERCALVLDDLCAGGFDELFNLLIVLVPFNAVAVGRMLFIRINVIVCNVDKAPGDEGGIAVLTVDMRMHVLRADAEALGKR